MTKRCTYKGCKKVAAVGDYAENGKPYYRPHCNSHYRLLQRYTVNGFLEHLYGNMRRRVSDPNYKGARWYHGKPIMSREIFYDWAKNHPDFLKLFKRWASSKYDRRLAPSVNRINSKKGYTLDNVEWMTFSLNCSLAGSVKHSNHKQVQAIRKLVGVKNG